MSRNLHEGIDPGWNRDLLLSNCHTSGFELLKCVTPCCHRHLDFLILLALYSILATPASALIYSSCPGLSRDI